MWHAPQAFVMDVMRTESRAFSRSREMADCLRRELLYSEKRPRDTVFRTIEQILAEQDRTGEHRILSRLTRDAVARAAQHASPAPVRWDVTGKTVVKAMVGAGVLLTPKGEPVPTGIVAPATPVATVRDQFEDITEAFLLETLIRRLNDVTIHDHRALAQRSSVNSIGRSRSTISKIVSSCCSRGSQIASNCRAIATWRAGPRPAAGRAPAVSGTRGGPRLTAELTPIYTPEPATRVRNSGSGRGPGREPADSTENISTKGGRPSVACTMLIRGGVNPFTTELKTASKRGGLPVRVKWRRACGASCSIRKSGRATRCSR